MECVEIWKRRQTTNRLEVKLQVSLAITRQVGSIDLNRVMGGARYSFCREWSGCTLPSVVHVEGDSTFIWVFPGIYQRKMTFFMNYLYE